MRRPTRLSLLATVAVALALPLSAVPSTASTATAPWRMYLGNAKHWSYNASATAITTSNASTLHPLWSVTGTGGSWASPVAASGSVYAATLSGALERLDVTTGAVQAQVSLGVR